jgi:hypothetical protein
MALGEDAIRAEFEANGTDVDKACLRYVLEAGAGTDTTDFWNGRMDGKRPADFGLKLDGFVEKEEAVEADLEREEVIALRVYTTAAYKSLNDPLLRNMGSSKPAAQHPFPATMGFLASGIKKLRGNDKSGVTTDLFRGLGGVAVGEAFLESGGVMSAPMSTSKAMTTAFKYAASQHMLILKFKTENFRQRGADISFLSAFPEESEYLYPPGTYLQPGPRESFTIGDVELTVVEVTPDIE